MGHGLQYVGWREPGATWEGWDVGNDGGTRLRCLGFLSVRRWAFFLSIMTLDLRCWVEVSMLFVSCFLSGLFLTALTQWVCQASRGHDDSFLLFLIFYTIRNILVWSGQIDIFVVIFIESTRLELYALSVWFW